ncbi:MAG: hypothetical protein QME12_05405 [Nanoarchaeota archaeon]|nr:hypothetical protein [Nanoarchaeota archaeon]
MDRKELKAQKEGWLKKLMHKKPIRENPLSTPIDSHLTHLPYTRHKFINRK